MAGKKQYTIPGSKQARRHSKRIVPIAIATAFVSVAIIVACLLIFKPFQNRSSQNGSDNNTPQDNTTSESADHPNVKGDNYTQSDPAKTESGNDALIEGKTPVKYEGGPVSSDSITGVITYAGVNSANFIIRTSIDQYLADGTCELSLTGPTSYSAATLVIPEASTSTCQGFDIPLSDLSSGEYNIQINITSGSLSGTLTGKGVI